MQDVPAANVPAGHRAALDPKSYILGGVLLSHSLTGKLPKPEHAAHSLSCSVLRCSHLGASGCIEGFGCSPVQVLEHR